MSLVRVPVPQAALDRDAVVARLEVERAPTAALSSRDRASAASVTERTVPTGWEPKVHRTC